MEEDAGVKAPVTRLRRRLSVEQSEDVSSPATPTKKRGGRLAAKPQLELIDENAKVNSPRKPRRKSIVKDVADAEEKPVTPSRRSTRIKSNTSIVSETLTAQTTGSPRAKRALRRNSQAGSDNEGPATPARARRTRKDSASSVENQEPAPLTRPLQVAEMVIAEEPENDIQKPDNNQTTKLSPRIPVEDLSPNSARKSKRLSEKRSRRSGSYKSDLDTSVNSEGNTNSNTTKKEKKKSETKANSSKQLNESGANIEQTDKLSESNKSLLKTLNTDSKVNLSNHNKSVSDLDNEKKKRVRTESWPSVTISPANEIIVFSDNEYSKKKRKKSLINNSNSDAKNTSIKENNIEITQNENGNSEILINTETSFSCNEEKKPVVIQPSETTTNEDSSTTSEKAISKSESNDIRRDMAILFESTPSDVQTVVYFEDSDSNSVNTETVNKIQQSSGDDQCVPVVKHDMEFENKSLTNSPNQVLNSKEIVFSSQVMAEKVNDSCEPMDIDETIDEDILHQKSLHDSNTVLKSLSHDTSNMEQLNKSKRKSSISASEKLERSKNENKSTLILSQLKDASVTSNNTLKSPKAINEVLSTSVNVTANINSKVPKTNLSLNDIKGTPLKQNNVQILSMQTSTPITMQTTDNKINLEVNHDSKKDSSGFSKSIDESSAEDSDEECDESSKPKSKYIDDEAEEACENYESGDSRDEEDRQYEDENEIIEKGETLGSDDDVSNDTDYEKDSFVVSSDAEDNELLSGSGEDLSMCDNELTMSKKSKKKYNERKLKEQKKASREMFESRHKMNSPELKSPASKTKNNRMRIDSSLLESDEEVVVKTKKNNRLRLDSTIDTSAHQEEADKSHNKSNKKLNKSMENQSAMNEKEITVCNDIVDAKDPLTVEFKIEPKTPQRDLNISVVHFTATQAIENVEVAESNSILNQTETDPLQATMNHEDSDSSESEELLQNYDLVLNELSKKSKLNQNNVSLNLGKKNKKPKDEPIIEHLNLTNTKKQKKTQEESQDVVDSKTRPQEKPGLDTEDSSNSIDLQLLFSEDNCGSGDENDQNNPQINDDDEPMFVPLKKTPGKTNMRESIDINTSQQNHSLNESGKKKKKRKSSLMLDDSISKTLDTDTPGMNETTTQKNRKTTLVTSESADEPQDSNKPEFNNESIKKKKRKSSITKNPMEEPQDASKSEFNESIKKKNRKSSVTIEPVEELQDSGETKLKGSIKKKHRKSSITTETIGESEDTKKAEMNTTVLNESKKKNRKTSLVTTESTGELQEISNKELLNESARNKKKRKSSLAAEEVKEPEDNFFFIDTTGAVASDKEDIGFEKPLEVIPGSTEKKKKKSLDASQNMMLEKDDDDDSDGAPVEVLYRSEKACHNEAESLDAENNLESSVTESGKKKKKKKKKKSAVLNQSGENNKTEDVSLNSSKKRKRKSSDTGVPQGSAQDIQEIIQNESLPAGRHKKKRKILHNDGFNEQNQVQAETARDDEKRSKKKKKTRELPVSFQNMSAEQETIMPEVKKNKKRKERDEDNDSKKTKVSKDNSFHEVHLPTLPASILNQLDDKPKKVPEKPKVVSTSKFIVENSRQKRAKPSNYLEESVYLDADSPLTKKEKPRMKKPKVLPFIPTASISDSGFTTNFKINKVPQSVQFVAEAAGISFSKELYLQKDKLKRLGTYDLYKKQIHKKLSKF